MLEALARAGTASAARLAEETSLPRGTVHRLLETLQARGYVTRTGPRHAYRLALKVRGLAESYREEDWVTEIAEPVISDLSEEVVWPVDLSTYENGEMVIRTTTHRRSPLSIVRVAAGLHLGMLQTSTGRAYLAFCPAAERAAILDLIGRRASQEAAIKEIELTRRRGYAVRVRGVSQKTASMSVPVMHGERVLACITLIWIDSALAATAAVRKYLGPVRRAAARIETEYRRRVDGFT